MKLSDLSDEQWFQRLDKRRRNRLPDLEEKWKYYNGEQPLFYVARILAEQDDRFPPLRINLAALAVEPLEERLDVEGFLLGASGSLDQDLWRVWQANDLDEESHQGHTSSLVTRESYIVVGPSDTDDPLITVEYPEHVAVEVDPRTRRVIASLKVYKSDEEAPTEDMAVLQLPGRLVKFETGKPYSDSKQEWARSLEKHQTSPLVPVVPMINQPIKGIGRSELSAIIPLVDATNQIATNMLAAIEHHSVPRRWAIGVQQSDFVDGNGRQLTPFEIATGPLWAIPRADDEQDDRPIELGQFAASDLRNFHDSLKLISSYVSSLYGLPPHYMGHSSDNPASADAIRSSEARLVKRVERRQRSFGGAWERAMRIALAVMERDPAEANALSTQWRNAATPTRAAMIDASTKAFTAGFIDAEQAQEDSGYTQAQRLAMANRKRVGGSARVAADAIRALDVGGHDAPAAGGIPGS